MSFTFVLQMLNVIAVVDHHKDVCQGILRVMTACNGLCQADLSKFCCCYRLGKGQPPCPWRMLLPSLQSPV